MVGVLIFQTELGCRRLAFGFEEQLSSNYHAEKTNGIKPGDMERVGSGSVGQSQRSGMRKATESGSCSSPVRVVVCQEAKTVLEREILSSFLYFGAVRGWEESQKFQLLLTFFHLFTKETIKTNFSLGNQGMVATACDTSSGS